MILSGILSWIREHPAYRDLLHQVQAGMALPPQELLPAAGSAILAALLADLDLPLLVVTPTVDEGRRLLQALRTWLPAAQDILSFPAPPVLPYERAPWTPETIADRLRVLSTLFLHRVGAVEETAPPVVVASARALLQRPLPYRQFYKATRKLEVGAEVSLTALARHCQGIGYESVTVVEVPGQISRRGGILDIFPPQAPLPYRLDFWGDELDAIRTFEPATQRSVDRVRGFWITPVREALPQDTGRALEPLQALLATELPPEVRGPLEDDAQSLDVGAPFRSLEFYLPYLYQEVSTLLSYFPVGAQVILYNAAALPLRWQELEEAAEEQRERSVRERLILPDAPVPYVPWSHWEAALPGERVLSLEYGEAGPLGGAFDPEVHFAGRLGEALGRLRQWVGLGDQVVVVSRQAGRLAELWQQFTPPPVLKELVEPPEGLITFVQGVGPAGWQVSHARRTRHLITDEELFGWRPPEPRRRPRRRVTASEFPFADLEPGTFVVHEDYGIGLFRGLVQRSIDDIEREYLLVEYAGQDRLFVPIHQADRLTRYVGAEGLGPRLSRLDTQAWEETKARVEQATEALAGDLLDLYAERQVVKGHAFAPDTAWQAELEAAFPYVETQDQIEAIQAVKADMEQPQPMDRLICGDAGYGKTEVALRAAFKAVMDGKQVAMLVPTTVLAQQHYLTFRERLEPFPVHVELLSRFRTSAEQRKIIEGLILGQVDVVIGTHRLLQDDVRFDDLGLVIIDEEQRFGVAHKEKLKQMRTEVDVLTLTATPIPRTLYMALTGVRDVSIIETPPQERLPLSTYVGPYDADVVRRAIRREMGRSGQTFYVHNRVETIQSVARRLETLVPEARVGVAHGQMRERDLAEIMERFTAGEVDVLVATTIIESGLDFPNANTLIVEHADHFGLAQLYQLRGRVGRGTRRGYAYLFQSRRLQEEGRYRLQALRESTGLGGGFSIALRDLELRGAGDLLGARQHGHIAAVGFSLYTQLLSRTVGRLQAQRAGQPLPPATVSSITIELPLAVGLPADYVPDDQLRLRLYRRLAELTDAEEIAELEEELRDRFGSLPQTAENLIYQLRLKVLARDAHIPTIVVESGQIALRPPWLRNVPPEETGQLRRLLGERARLGRREIWLPLSWEEERWRANLQEVLEALAGWWAARG
jgi:transcription-repair coupling factor (superfamily II helicase)